MKHQSSLKKVKQGKYLYIYIYFKYKGKIIRVNTGNKVVSSKMNTDLKYNSKMNNYQILNKRTDELKLKVDTYLLRKLQCESLETISQRECMDFIENGLMSGYMNQPTNDKVIDLLEIFYEFKKEELNNRPSYKDYLTLLNSFKDYQNLYSTVLRLRDINSIEFLVSFRNFLSKKRKKNSLTVGELNDNTINKRFSTLKTFFHWLENKGLYSFKKTVLSFNIPKYENNIIVLNKEELKSLRDLNIEKPEWERIIDLFVFNCFIGLRFSDLSSIKKQNFLMDDDGDYILFMENQKTRFSVQILVQKTSLNILKKYNFELPTYTQQYFNRQLKKIFSHYDLFGEKVIKKRRVLKTIKDKEYLKRDLISSHTCRRTFITLSISNNVPINSLMLSSGHKKIQTIQSYMSKILDKKSFKNIDL